MDGFLVLTGPLLSKNVLQIRSIENFLKIISPKLFQKFKCLGSSGKSGTSYFRQDTYAKLF